MKHHLTSKSLAMALWFLMSLTLGCATAPKQASNTEHATVPQEEQSSLSDTDKEALLQAWQTLKPGLERLLAIETELNALLEQLVLLQSGAEPTDQQSVQNMASNAPEKPIANNDHAMTSPTDGQATDERTAEHSNHSQNEPVARTVPAPAPAPIESAKTLTPTASSAANPQTRLSRDAKPIKPKGHSERIDTPADPEQSLFAVQVASSKDHKALREIYSRLIEQHPVITGTLEPNFQIANVKRSRYYRLKLGNYQSKSAASNKCQELQAAGVDCIVSNYTPSDFSLILDN